VQEEICRGAGRSSPKVFASYTLVSNMDSKLSAKTSLYMQQNDKYNIDVQPTRD